MNREIIFRAWDKINKKMILPDEENAKYWKSFPILPACDFSLCRGVLWNKKRANNYILMQFTGLKDKKGKEIYEGDILKYAQYPLGITMYEIGEVSNINGLLLIDGHSLTGTKIKKHLCSLNTQTENVCIGLNNTGDVEVIGNIYEYKIK